MSQLQIIILVIAVAAIAAILASIRIRRQDIKKVAYMMDALEDGELNFRFKDSSKFNRTLNRIRTILDQAHTRAHARNNEYGIAHRFALRRTREVGR